MLALIEFETKEEALGALTRDQKTFNGNILEVHLDVGSTLWVTNFPPAADEAYIRGLFDKVCVSGFRYTLAHRLNDFLVRPNPRCALSLTQISHRPTVLLCAVCLV